MYEVHVLPSADDHLLKIANYISNELYNPTAALSLIDHFERSIVELKDFPNRYPVHESDVVKTEFRKLTLGNYLIFYTVDGKYVYVAFILHEKQDFDATY